MQRRRAVRGSAAAIVAGLVATRTPPLDPVAIGIAAFVVGFLGWQLGRYRGGVVAGLGLAFVFVGVFAATLDFWIPWHFCCNERSLHALFLLDRTDRIVVWMAIGYAAVLAGGISYVRGVLAHEPAFKPRWRTAHFTVGSQAPDHVTAVDQYIIASASQMPADATQRPADSRVSPHRTRASPDMPR